MIRRICGIAFALCLLLTAALSSAETGGILTFTLQVPYRSDKTRFGFELQLEDDTISGKYGSLTFADGVSNFSMSKGDIVRVYGLPAGLSYTLKSSNEDSDYLERFYDAEGHEVSAASGTVPFSEDGGFSVAELDMRKSASLALRLDLTDVVTDPDSVTVVGMDDSSANGTTLPLTVTGGKVIAGPLTLNPTAYGKYGNSGSHVYEYQILSSEGNKTDQRIKVTVSLQDGGTLAVTDDYYTVDTALYEDGDRIARQNWEGTGRLQVAFTDLGGSFASKALAGGTDLQLTGNVLLVGREMNAGEFGYALMENGEVIATAKNSESGKIDFTAVSYSPDDVGVHIYTLAQTGGAEGDIFYDDREYTIGVVVTNTNGDVRASVSSVTVDGRNTNRISFENKFAIMDFKVYNLWQGGNEGNIELVLFANGEKMHPQPKYSVDGATYVYSDLPMFDSAGNKITYSARELYVDEYMAMYVNTGDYAARTHMLYNGGTVINRKVTEFSFQVKYYGIDGKLKPDVLFMLYNNGSLYYEKTQPKLDEYGQYIYNRLPVKNAGTLSGYSVQAVPMEGYIISYQNVGDYAGITDSLYEGGTVTVRRVPRTGDDTDCSLPVFAVCCAGFVCTLLLLRQSEKKKQNKGEARCPPVRTPGSE